MNVTASYGTARVRRADVSYAQIEEAASTILLTGTRPTSDNVREALKGGSQRTLLLGLQRFWKELGGRLNGVPDTRRRLPAAVAELADSIWEKALEVAMEAAQGSDEKLKAELAAMRADNETRSYALSQREIETETLVRSRERTIRELEDHLRSTMALLNKRDSAIRSLESRLISALAESEGYRHRLAAVVTRMAAKRPVAASPKGRRMAPAPSARQKRKLRKRPATPKPQKGAAAARLRSKSPKTTSFRRQRR